jgi:hypothetical protein
MEDNQNSSLTIDLSEDDLDDHKKLLDWYNHETETGR